MDVAAGLRECARRVEAAGHPVTELPGFATRGRGTLAPWVAVDHHTAGARSGPSPSLQVCTTGQAGLRNALCNTYSSRRWGAQRPRLFLVAARLAWHAGAGGWRGVAGNSRALGHEAENDGVGEPWDDEHLDLIAVLDTAQADVFGYGAWMVCEHKEWAPQRKPDRHGVDGDDWRALVANLLTPGPPAPPVPIELPEDDMRLVRSRDNGSVWLLTGGVRFRVATRAELDDWAAAGAAHIVAAGRVDGHPLPDAAIEQIPWPHPHARPHQPA